MPSPPTHEHHDQAERLKHCDREAKEIHDWVTVNGYLNAPMSERARRCIQDFQIKTRLLEQVADAARAKLASADEAWETLGLTPEDIGAFDTNGVWAALRHALARLDESGPTRPEHPAHG